MRIRLQVEQAQGTLGADLDLACPAAPLFRLARSGWPDKFDLVLGVAVAVMAKAVGATVASPPRK